MVKRETVKEEPTSLDINQVAANVVKMPMEEFLHENYLPFAYYVIRNRALVGVDGLKPVNRRILYAMYKMKLFPNAGHLKAQMIVGEVMGKYHPHGDSGISGGLSHMAQKFATRVPLIDPHGSVGYATGDRAAAARYWEARLTKPAMELLKDLDNNALEMGRNYDDTLEEPVVLPARWPTTIINGTDGIAVGYASTIFPNNPTEVMDAAIAILKNPDITIDELMKIMPGPDFPTGGELIGSDGIRDMYTTGKGTFNVRGRYKTKQLNRGRTEIIFYELPFQVSAENVKTRIQKLKKDGKLPEISEYKDLSDMKHLVNFSIILKSGSNVKLVLNELFNSTPLMTKFTSNNTVLDEGMPVKKGIIGLFEQFLSLREECTRNIDQTQIDKYDKAIHKNEGIIKVLTDLDKAIEIIKNSDTQETAKAKLIKTFKLDDEQAEFILSMQLRRLTKSDRTSLLETNEDLVEKRDELDKILKDPVLFKQQIIDDLEETKKVIADDRRTVILDMSMDDLKDTTKLAKAEEKAKAKGEAYFVRFADNSLYKGNRLPVGKNLLPIKSITHASLQDDLYALLADGTGVRIPTSYIPFDKIVDATVLGIQSNSPIVGLGKIETDKDDIGMLIVTERGKVVITDGKLPASTQEFNVLQVDDDDKIIFAQYIDKSLKDKTLAMVSSDSNVLRIDYSTLRVTGFGSQGVKGMNVADNAHLVSAFLVQEDDKIVSMTSGSIKSTNVDEIGVKGRGGKGMVLHKLSARTGLELLDAFGGQYVTMGDLMGNQLAMPAVNKRAAAGTKFPTVGLELGLDANKLAQEINPPVDSDKK